MNSNDLHVRFDHLISDLEIQWGIREGEMNISGPNAKILTEKTTMDLLNRLVPLNISVQSCNADVENSSVDPATYEQASVLHQMLAETGAENTLRSVHCDLMDSRKRRLSEYGQLMRTMMQQLNDELVANDSNNMRVVPKLDDDEMMRISRLLEILYVSENVQSGIRQLMHLLSSGSQALKNVPGAISPITIFGKRFKREQEMKPTAQTQLVLNMLTKLSLFGYRRYGESVMTPVIIDGIYTYAWQKKCSIEEFVWANINSHLHTENFEFAMQGKGNIQYCIDFLKKCAQHEFEDLKKERRIHAFRNAIYITAVMGDNGVFTPTSHTILFKQANPANDSTLQRMTKGGRVAACFHDCDFPEETIDDKRIANAETFERISTHQRWTEEVKEWFRAACGRMLHPIASTPSPLTLEKWQVFFMLIGVGNSGKSTTIDNIIYNFFDPDDVAYIQNNLEKMYGWSKCKNKYIWLAPEITANFAEHCDQAQFQQVVEGGRLASAKKYAVDTIDFDPFDLPGMMGANETINFHDNGESVSRRRVDFWFGLPINSVDPMMPEKLKNELGHIIYICNESYLTKTREVKNRIWDVLPPYFLELRNENAANTNSLEHFLQNGRLRYHPDFFMSQTEFQQMYMIHCKQNDLHRKTLKKELTQGPFFKRHIRSEKTQRVCPVENITKYAIWLFGVSAMRDDDVL